jgi:hypothetical protein
LQRQLQRTNLPADGLFLGLQSLLASQSASIWRWRWLSPSRAFCRCSCAPLLGTATDTGTLLPFSSCFAFGGAGLDGIVSAC